MRVTVLVFEKMAIYLYTENPPVLNALVQMAPFSSFEAALLLVSTKNRESREGPNRACIRRGPFSALLSAHSVRPLKLLGWIAVVREFFCKHE